MREPYLKTQFYCFELIALCADLTIFVLGCPGGHMRLQTRKDSQNPELCHSHLVFFDWKPYLQISCFCTLIKHPPTHLHSRLLLKFAVPRGLGGDLDWSPNLTNGILVWGVRGGRKAPQGAKNNNFFCPKWGRWSVSGVFPCRSSSI